MPEPLLSPSPKTCGFHDAIDKYHTGNNPEIEDCQKNSLIFGKTKTWKGSKKQ